MPEIAHFCRFYFSLGLKSLISAVFNFRWASNRSFHPFLIFIGPQIVHFSRFKFSLEPSRIVSVSFNRKITKNNPISYHFAQELHKNLSFLRVLACFRN